MEKIAIWGASGHSKVISDIIKIRKEYEIIGYIDNINLNRKGENFLSSYILGSEEMLDKLTEDKVKFFFIAFGNCKARLKISNLVLSKGFDLINVIHPKSIIADDVIIGKGNAIMAGTIINPSVYIGNNTILNTRCCIEHDCYIEDGCHICPGVTMGGNVKIGKETWVGIGSTIKDNILIGENCYIGAGTNLINSIPDNSLVYGNPGKIIKKYE
jgi:sugar O-acyltransferase (sialic acid O-acetyltransferase NeuD family)